MDNRFEEKLDKIVDKIADIDKTLAAQHESLKLHIKRSDLLEEHLELFRNQISPIEKHVSMVNGGLKLITLSCIIIGAITSILLVIKTH